VVDSSVSAIIKTLSKQVKPMIAVMFPSFLCEARRVEAFTGNFNPQF
jgi:hypothetical protein